MILSQNAESNLLSELLGAIVGGAIAGTFSYIGAVRAAKQSADAGRGLFDDERRSQRLERQQAMAETLNAELACHRAIIQSGSYGFQKAGLMPHFWRV
jgi:hypothetical protein